MRSNSLVLCGLLAAAVAVVAGVAGVVASKDVCGTGKAYNDRGVSWPSWSADENASGFSKGSQLTAHNVGQLSKTWQYVAGPNQLTATKFPSLRGALSSNGVLYWAMGDGPIVAFDELTGSVLWTFNTVTELGRATAIVKGGLYLNEETDELVAGTHDLGNAVLFAVHPKAGTLKWKTKVLDTDATAWITGTPSYSKSTQMYYIGMSSRETTTATTPTYACCQFVGKVFAVHRCNATVAWVSYMSPPSTVPGQNPSFPGASVWASGMPLTDDGALIVSTGQNYRVPDALANCRAAVTAGCVNASAATHLSCVLNGRRACRDQFDIPQNMMESIVSLDAKTGAVRWSYRAGDDGAWTAACVTAPLTNPNCQRADIGPDGDFGMPCMRMRIKIRGESGRVKVLVCGQKTGMLHVLREKDGSLVHAMPAAPGGGYGGFMWAASNNDDLAFFANSNFAAKQYALADGTLYSGASVIAYNPETNTKAWEFLDPLNGQLPTGFVPPPNTVDSVSPQWAMMPGPTAATNDVVFASSTSGHFYALNADTGALLYAANPHGGSLGAGVIIGKSGVYMSTGYRSGGYSVNKTEPFLITRYGLPIANTNDRDTNSYDD